MQKTITLIALLCALSTAVWAQAPSTTQQPSRPAGAVPGLRGVACPTSVMTIPAANSVRYLTDSLQLNENQVSSLTDLLSKANAKINELKNTSREASETLRNALYDSTKDASTVKALLVSAQNADAAVANAEMDTWIQMRTVLSADQMKKLGETRIITGFGPGGFGGQRSQHTQNNSDGAGTPPPAPPAPGQ